MNRRSLLAIGASALIFPQNAAAVPTATAQTLVDGLVAEVNDVIAANLSETAMINRFAAIFDRYSDVPTIARYCLGVEARSAAVAALSKWIGMYPTALADPRSSTSLSKA